MLKRTAWLALIICIGTAIWWFFAVKSSENNLSPPLIGWMRNFAPTLDVRPAPTRGMLARNGEVRKFSEFRGKMVLVNFWATWCGPCIREMPSLLRLQKERGGKEFIIVAVSQNLRGWTVVAPFVQKYDLAGLNVLVDQALALSREMNVKVLPTTVLLDRAGREVGRLAGSAEWDSLEAVQLIDYYARAGIGVSPE